MTQSSWSTETTQRIADAIRAQRGSNSAQWLSDRTAELGFRVARSRISDLETGRRNRIDVTELIVLAKALGIPPLLLLYPGVPGEIIDAIPQIDGAPSATTSIAAAQWFSGEQPLQFLITDPDGDQELTYWGQELEDHVEGGRALNYAREEVHLINELTAADIQLDQTLQGQAALTSRLDRIREQAKRSLDTEEKDALEQQLETLVVQRDHSAARTDYAITANNDLRKRITDIRQRQRDAGIEPAPLPRRYQHLDTE